MDKKLLKEIAVELYDVDAVKYGDFVTKVGLRTPIYIDLRVIIAYPKLMVKLSNQLWSLMDNDHSKYDQICGVPYTALPLGTLISEQTNVPMLMRRKEAKSYGTKKMIEGVYKQGDVAVIVEDIITSGSSILETVRDLNNEGIEVNDALIIVDREQGGRKHLEQSGIKVRSLFKISELMQYLFEAGRLDEASVKVVTDYVKAVQAPVKVESERLITDFKTRAKSAKNQVAAKILNLMASKKTTVCLATDYTKSSEILDLAELAGPHIAVLKIHVDVIDDFNKNFPTSLKAIAKKHDFLIMEDRKFADIGNTVLHQFRNGVFHIAEWADCVTVHAIPGPGVLDGIRDGLKDISEDRGVFVLAEMSSKGSLATGEYAKSATSMAKGDDLVAGVVCQNNLFDDLGLVQLTPGVKLYKSADNLGQQYNTPAHVVKSGADLIVVGRGITEAKDKLAAVLEYKKVLYEEYQNRVARV